MSLIQILVLLIVALIASVLSMLLVPRQKRALPFQIVMWVAAWIVAGLSALLVQDAVRSVEALQFLARLSIADVPLLPIALGALGGALLLTVPLWMMDRFAVSDEEM